MDEHMQEELVRIGQDILFNQQTRPAQENIDLIIQNNRQNIENLHQSIKDKENQQFNVFTQTITKSLSDMGQTLVQAIQDSFKKSSEDLNRNRAEEGEQSSSTNSKGKRKTGPYSKLLSSNKKLKSKSDDNEEDDYLSVDASTGYDTEISDVELDADNDLRKVLKAGNDSKEQNSSEEDAVDNLLNDFNYEDKCDPKIEDKLSEAINKVWQQKLSKEKVKERLEKHYRPENCSQLILNKVNPELFTSLSKGKRSTDIKFQKLQKYNINAAIPIVKQLDLLKSIKPGEKISSKTLIKLQNLASDSLGMLSSSNNNILQIRRDAISPELQSDYRQLKNDVPSGSKLLFGDDLKSRLTSIKASNKASKGAIKSDLRNKLNNSYSKNFKGGSRRGYNPTFNQRQKRFNNNNNNYNNNYKNNNKNFKKN